jgi:ElaB/YqjD/DUF883 family membrane-anchored ribosome-binding protein
MTNEYISATPPDTTGQSGSATDTAREQASQLGHQTKDEAANVAGTVKDETANVVGTTKEEAGKVVGESKKQAKALFDEAREQLTEQAGVQQQRVATGLRGIGDELTRMSESSDQQGIAGDLVSQMASRTSDVASWLDGRDPGSVLTEVRNFARRKPGTFIAVSAVAGLVAGRLVKSLASEAQDEKADAAAAPAPHFVAAGNNVAPPAPPTVGDTPVFDQVAPVSQSVYVPGATTTDGRQL